MTNILLTGGGGFIGSHLKNFLCKNHVLFVPRSYELDLLDKKAIGKFVVENKIDFIVHSAAKGVRITSEATMEAIAKPNIKMFKNLAELGLKMITIGSGAEYDKSRSLHKVSESEFGLSIPKDPYGYSKYLISKEIEKQKHILNLRVFGVYGFGENSTRVTSYAITQNLAHLPINICQDALFDYIYIDDLCKIVEYFILHETKYKFLNVTPTQSILISDIVRLINDISDFRSDIIIEKPGLNKEYTGSNSLLYQEMPELNFTPYKNGLEMVYQRSKNAR